MESNTTAQFQLLKASYNSPTSEPFTHITNIRAPPTTKTPDRVAYLGAVKKATATLQEHINKELTLRMEEDKVREASKGKTNGAVDDGKEEENYGEEVVDED
jgi:hypothetical protein